MYIFNYEILPFIFVRYNSVIAVQRQEIRLLTNWPPTTVTSAAKSSKHLVFLANKHDVA